MRLIDADKLLERMKKGMESGSNLNGTFDLYIEHAPTVKPNGDLISRQDAIRWVKTECNPYGKPTLDFESGKRVIEHLGQMPSADRQTVDKEYLIDLIQEAVYDGEACAKLMDLVDRPTGEWVLDPNGMDWNIPAWRCSKCGFVANYIGVEANGLGSNPMNWAGSKFCPNCGAKME